MSEEGQKIKSEWETIVNEFEDNRKAIDWIINLINRNKDISYTNILLKKILIKYYRGIDLSKDEEEYVERIIEEDERRR